MPGKVTKGPHDAEVTMTSRLRRAPGDRHPWTCADGVIVDLPVILDFVIRDRASGRVYCLTEATVDLIAGAPALVRVTVEAPKGIDITWTQREFRWSGPLEVVTRMVPAMLCRGQDPFTADFPVTDLPAATRPPASRQLSVEFLEDVAREYLTLGPGYAGNMATKYQVSPRTIVSWVEKARRRGILTATVPGRHGGSLAPNGPPVAPVANGSPQ